MTSVPGIDPTVPPSGAGCAECEERGGWWFHLRRCALCGHVGCCDSSPAQHADSHAKATGHPLIRSFEPGEDWYWNYVTAQYADNPGPELTPPLSHPVGQAVPAPPERVPADWQNRLN